MMHKQSSKSPWSLQLRQILVFILILSVSSCGGCEEGKGGGKKGKEGIPKRVFIMLIHGINDVKQNQETREIESKLTYAIEKFKQALEKDENVSSIDVFAPARKNSVTAPIQQQAKEMVDIIEGKKITEDDKLILIANSQGGAVAMAMYAMHMKDCKNLAIISVQGALCGTPAAQPNPAKFNQLTQGIQQLIGTVKQLIQTNQVTSLEGLLQFVGESDGMKQQIIDNFPKDDGIAGQLKYVLGWQDRQGGQDLIPDSPFMQELRNKMPKPVTIPMLLVAGEVEDFIKCISKVVFDDTKRRILKDLEKKMKNNPLGKTAIQMAPGYLDAIIAEIVQKNEVKQAINNKIQKAWNEVVSNNQPNDLVIPISSQLGEGLIKGDQVQRITRKDYGHLDSMINDGPFQEEVQFIKDFIKK